MLRLACHVIAFNMESFNGQDVLIINNASMRCRSMVGMCAGIVLGALLQVMSRVPFWQLLPPIRQTVHGVSISVNSLD